MQQFYKKNDYYFRLVAYCNDTTRQEQGINFALKMQVY